MYASRVAAQICPRARDQITGFFDGYSLADPGLAWIPQWRPESAAGVPENPEQFWGLVGVGRRDAG